MINLLKSVRNNRTNSYTGPKSQWNDPEHEVSPLIGLDPTEITPLDLAAWPPSDHPNYANDTAFLAVGSTANLLSHVYDGIVIARLGTSSVNQARGASVTAQDLEVLREISRLHEAWVSPSSKGSDPVNRFWHPSSPVIAAHALGRGSITGLASDPRLALKMIKANPLIRSDLQRFAENVVAGYHIHRSVAGKTVWIGGFGGTEPWARYVMKQVASTINETMRINVKILPSPDELLSRSNAKAEVFRLLKAGIPETQLVIVTQNNRRGSHVHDDALINGLITITGAAKQGREIDGASLLRTLAMHGCGWVEAHPVAVHVPGVKGSQDWPKQRRVDSITGFLAERDGGRTLGILLAEANKLLETSPDSLHVLAVAGHFFHETEIADLKEGLLSLLPGRVIPVINPVERPKVSGLLLRYTLCDFVVADHLPPTVMALFSQEDHRFSHKESMRPSEFLDRTPPPAGLRAAEQVEEELGSLVWG